MSAAAEPLGQRPTVRVAYLVWTHAQPDHVLRLLRTLRALSADSHIVVHHDRTNCALDETAVAALGGTHVLYAAEPMRWGDVSMLDALLRCLRWIEENLDYDWIVHLSGADYPIRPLRELEERLASEGKDGYIIHDRLGTEDEVRDRREEAYRRYFYQYYQLPQLRLSRVLPGRARTVLRRRTERLKAVPAAMYVKPLPRGQGVRVGRRSRRALFRDGYACYKGSLWVALSRKSVQCYLRTLRERPEIYRYYARTINPDESITATVLANDPTIQLDPDPLRYTNWVSGRPHPEVLTTKDLEAMLASGKYFARKFDPAADEQVFDALDQRLGITVKGLDSQPRSAS